MFYNIVKQNEISVQMQQNVAVTISPELRGCCAAFSALHK